MGSIKRSSMAFDSIRVTSAIANLSKACLTDILADVIRGQVLCDELAADVIVARVILERAEIVGTSGDKIAMRKALTYLDPASWCSAEPTCNYLAYKNGRCAMHQEERA